uniref:Uncharacterized protein n=1 Tax=Rhizophagus irregularis (strain DAOM 181602 / DAOM 197198 / MUCL 43194) TaxID=747089 RepID=U9V851_RHIID
MGDGQIKEQKEEKGRESKREVKEQMKECKITFNISELNETHTISTNEHSVGITRNNLGSIISKYYTDRDSRGLTKFLKTYYSIIMNLLASNTFESCDLLST